MPFKPSQPIGYPVRGYSSVPDVRSTLSPDGPFRPMRRPHQPVVPTPPRGIDNMPQFENFPMTLHELTDFSPVVSKDSQDDWYSSDEEFSEETYDHNYHTSYIPLSHYESGEQEHHQEHYEKTAQPIYSNHNEISPFHDFGIKFKPRDVYDTRIKRQPLYSTSTTTSTTPAPPTTTETTLVSDPTSYQPELGNFISSAEHFDIPKVPDLTPELSSKVHANPYQSNYRRQKYLSTAFKKPTKPSQTSSQERHPSPYTSSQERHPSPYTSGEERHPSPYTSIHSIPNFSFLRFIRHTSHHLQERGQPRRQRT